MLGIMQVGKADCVPLSEFGHFLRADAAAAWERARAAFGRRVLLTDSWRSLAVQEKIFLERYHRGDLRALPGYTGDVRVWQGQQWTRRLGTAAAAVPGTSNHGGGLAVDVKTRRAAGDPGCDVAVVFTSFSDPDRLAWLAAAKEHGWADDEGRAVSEPWHMTYYPSRDKWRNKENISNGTVGYKMIPVNFAKDMVTGRDVKVVQGLLCANGYLTAIDGRGGADTRAKVLLFQKDKGLKADCVVGADTLRRLIEG